LKFIIIKGFEVDFALSSLKGFAKRGICNILSSFGKFKRLGYNIDNKAPKRCALGGSRRHFTLY
jgi:hypothetical protein